MNKVIVLAGAPESASIDWATADLLDDFGGPLSRFAGWADSLAADDKAQSQRDRPAWRVLLEKRHKAASKTDGDVTESWLAGLQPGPAETQPYGRADFLAFTPGSSFFATPGAVNTPPRVFVAMSFETQPLSVAVPQAMLPDEEAETTLYLEEGDTTLSLFLEQSLAAHNELPSSMLDLSEILDRREDSRPAVRDRSGRVLQKPVSQAPGSMFASFTMPLSRATTQTTTQATAHLPPARPPLPTRWGPLTDLAAIPSAAYLVGIAPQTATVSAVVGVISVAEPRTIQTRWGGTASLVEVVVGDETRAGFGVTFWGGAPSLRPRDVLLLRHVALHIFGDRVYGSSLRRDQTKVHVLWPGEGEGERVAEDPEAARALVAKAGRVRDWALRCVGGGGGGGRDDQSQDEDTEENEESENGEPENEDSEDGDSPVAWPRTRTWDMPPADTQTDESTMDM
ncbi:hypothetical protein CMQ_6053 [Grosmannia clavigera kw1407]|uniref:Nucleic acid-binding protein n=1 Tax=Grosmannia clavigera (strain kw1407 / UAMH 11150) TaxID=655863 RepID=F0XLE8_GROCL|nr:uncharacterized protein CMQ_6053 [Grosmannia clavigera kw1407]EFX01111.1 hypothetical protein CMQ_6053 [Grosmannia clavigera kw1407]